MGESARGTESEVEHWNKIVAELRDDPAGRPVLDAALNRVNYFW
jgi:hypothetical protein